MFTTTSREHKAAVIGLVLLFLFAIPYSGAAQAGNADEGQKLFVKYCASCHGPDGSGSTAVGKAMGAKDLRSPEAKKLTDVEIATQINKGKGNMPPFGSSLKKEKVDDLIAYIRELGKTQPADKKP